MNKLLLHITRLVQKERGGIDHVRGIQDRLRYGIQGHFCVPGAGRHRHPPAGMATGRILQGGRMQEQGGEADMPYGFSGIATNGYLGKVSDSLSVAGTVHSKDPFGGRGGSRVPTPPVYQAGNRQPPHTPGDGGGYTTGTGDSSNVVVSRAACHELANRVRQVDDRVAGELDRISQQVESMCESVYVFPKTKPRVLGLKDSVKSSMGEFRDVSDETGAGMRRFSDDMGSIR